MVGHILVGDDLHDGTIGTTSLGSTIIVGDRIHRLRFGQDSTVNADARHIGRISADARLVGRITAAPPPDRVLPFMTPFMEPSRWSYTEQSRVIELPLRTDAAGEADPNDA